MLSSSVSGMNSSYKIAVLGLWHLGEIYSACLAELGHNVVGISDDRAVIGNFSKNIPPLAEPSLEDMIARNRAAGRLAFSSELSGVKDRDVVWITFDTPVNDDDESDPGIVFKTIEALAPHLREGALLVVSSQIPVGSSEKIVAAIKKARPTLKFDYVYSPENLRLGDAVKGFMEPGRVVAGTASDRALKIFKEILAKLPAEVVAMNPASAEMTKHALNAWLATSISFTNDIADLCERYGADVEAVAGALKTDPRVGPKAYLFAGLGFSGGTLGRDLKAMMKAAKEGSIKLPVIEGAFMKNTTRTALVPVRLAKELGELKGKKLAMFGVTYKAGTSTLRRSQPLEVEAMLRAKGAAFNLYDPWAKATEVAEKTPSSFSADPYLAAQGADAILVMTPSRAFGDLDFGRLKKAAKGDLFFDTCNILCDKEEVIRKAGFKYIRIGR